MADVLFIYNDRSAHSGYSTGLGVASISAFVRRRGFTTDLVYLKRDTPDREVLERVRRAGPAVVGFYGPSSGFWVVRLLSQLIRRSSPPVFQVYGGPQATLAPEVLLDAPGLDAVCVGPGEVPTLRLLERLRDGADVTTIPGLWVARREDHGRLITRNAQEPVGESADTLLDYDYSLFLNELQKNDDFDKDSFNLEMMLSRGCPFDCAFCSNRALRRAQGDRLLRPSVAASMGLIKRALAETGLRRIEFHDEILTVDKPWFREFCRVYAQEVAVPFWCNLRAGAFDEEDVRSLKAAGAERVFIGLESGNTRVRYDVLNKAVSEKQLVESVGWLRRHGIAVATQNLIGVPSETPSAFLDTVRLNARLDPEFSILSVFRPYPGTELAEVCRRQGLLVESSPAGAVDRVDPVLSLPGFSQRDIRMYHRHFARFIHYERLSRSPMGWLLPRLSERMARPLSALFEARCAALSASGRLRSGAARLGAHLVHPRG